MKIVNKIWIHFLYWATFLLIPVAVFAFEAKRAFLNCSYWSQTKREIKNQWSRYLKYIELSK